MRALRVNKTKVTSRNTFIDNLFALESERESKNDEKSLFRDFLLVKEYLHIKLNNNYVIIIY